MRRYFIVFGVIPVVILAAVVLIWRPAQAPTLNQNSMNQNNNVNTPTVNTVFTEIRTPTFVGSIPSNNEALIEAPNTVTLGFRNPIGPASTIRVEDSDGEVVHLGAGTFSDDRQTLTVLLQPEVSGPLSVEYSACNLSGECQNGSFGFTVISE